MTTGHTYGDKDVRIISKEHIYDGFLKFSKVKCCFKLFKGGWSSYVTRELIEKEEAVGVILYDETIKQKTTLGPTIPELISKHGAIPGIKVDKGVTSINDTEEVLTGGLEGLEDRCLEYETLGANFTMLRAVIKFGSGLPSNVCIEGNMQALSDYAKIVQEHNMVPIVEPEVLLDGDHSIEDCANATSRVLDQLFTAQYSVFRHSSS